MKILYKILSLVLVPAKWFFLIVFAIMLLLFVLTTYSCNQVEEPDNEIIELSYKIDSLFNAIPKPEKRFVHDTTLLRLIIDLDDKCNQLQKQLNTTQKQLEETQLQLISLRVSTTFGSLSNHSYEPLNKK